MSIPTSLTGLGVSVDRAVDKVTNKARIQFSHTGDDNDNRLPSLSDDRGQLEDTGYNMTPLPPLVSQSESHDKMMIWGSEQQCSHPGLREIELVECQDIHRFLRSPVEDDDDDEDEGGSTKDGKDEGPMSISSSSTASSASIGVKRNDNDSNKVESGAQRDKEVKGKITCSTEELDTCVTGINDEINTKPGGRGLKQSKSETNVCVSNLSTLKLSGSLSSALDSRGDALICLPNSKTNPYLNANDATSAQSLRRAAPSDHNSPALYHQKRHKEERIQFRNGSSEGGVGQRRRTSFDERVLPPKRQQLVRPLCQTEMGRISSLESGAQDAEIGQFPSSNTATVLPSQPDIGSNRKLARSSLREPSDFSHLYNACEVSQPKQPNRAVHMEASPLERPPGSAAESTSNPCKPYTMEKRPQTQFTYRRNCSSPKRTFTPPQSPLRTPQGSPHRQASIYFISKDTQRGVQSSPTIKTPAQDNESVSVRATVITNITPTGIPKAPLNNQHRNFNSSHNSSPKERSPSLKPKGVRPKIITYIRKNPQFKPPAADGHYQVSSLPTRLSAYPHGATLGSFKDTPTDLSKLDKETRGVPVLSASNLLHDKYRKEMQTNIFPSGLINRSIHAPGHTNTVTHTHPHSYTAPPKLGSKAGDFYGAQPKVERSTSFKETSAGGPLQIRTAAQAGGSGSLLRSGRGMRLGLGAVTRTASGSVKGKEPGQSQRSAISQPIQLVIPAASQKCQDAAAS